MRGCLYFLHIMTIVLPLLKTQRWLHAVLSKTTQHDSCLFSHPKRWSLLPSSVFSFSIAAITLSHTIKYPYCIHYLLSDSPGGHR